MKNLLATIPKGKFPDWATAERVCQRCDGTTDWGNGEWFWLINCRNLPTQSGIGAQCFMVFDFYIRGYFDVVDTDESDTKCLVLANWHPIEPYIVQKGFQGYRYTELRP